MSKLSKRWMTYLAILVGGGALFQAGGKAGCISTAGDAALFSVNGCFIFDCQNGILGGVIEPCNPVPLLVDCFQSE